MIQVRKANERGHFDHGWLNTYHTFSFADYHDPRHMGFRSLRVINDDRVAPAAGFPQHGHRDMEIITVVLDGEIEHRDSMGNGAVLRPGEVQHMTAGTGILHSEFNPSRTTPLHLYQIWILPDRRGHAPRYGQKLFPEAERLNRWRLVASPDGRDGSLPIHQDARLSVATLEPGRSLEYGLAGGRYGWLQVMRGGVKLNGTELSEGDGAAVSDEAGLRLEAAIPAEVLLFDLA
jgi:quercetin 2,3-dioxygenase